MTQKQKNLVLKIRYRVSFYNELNSFLFKAISSLQKSLALITLIWKDPVGSSGTCQLWTSGPHQYTDKGEIGTIEFL